MKLKGFRRLKSKFMKPCCKFFSEFKLKLKSRSFSLRPSRFRRRRFRAKAPRFTKPRSGQHTKATTKLRRVRRHDADQRFGVKLAELVSVFRSGRRSPELGSLIGDGNGAGKEPFPSPVTPAFVKAYRRRSGEEEACRSFESCMAEMVAEGGALQDLVDVEEVLHCCESLKSQVFVDLVSRFYGDVCKDLFHHSKQEQEMMTKSTRTK